MPTRKPRCVEDADAAVAIIREHHRRRQASRPQGRKGRAGR